MEFQYNPNQNQGVNPYGYVSANGGSSMYGSPENVNRSFFNQSRGFNFSDSTKFAMEQIAQREANAFNVAVMNYQNEYNSPLEQMKRYQAAGLNPYAQGAIAPVQSAGAPSSGAARGTASQVQAEANRLRLANDVVGNVNSIVRGIADTKRAYQEMRYYDEVYPHMIARAESEASIAKTNAFDLPGLNQKRAQNLDFSAFMSGLRVFEKAMDMGLSAQDLADVLMLTNIWQAIPTFSKDVYDRMSRHYGESYEWTNKQYGKDLRYWASQDKKTQKELRMSQYMEQVRYHDLSEQEKHRHNVVMERLFGAGLGAKLVEALIPG